MAATNTVVAPTSWVTSVFSIFGTLNWAEIGAAVEQKSIGAGITAAEHVAEAITTNLASAGNTIALEAEQVLPAAESILGAVLNLIPALHAAAPATPVATTPSLKA